MRNLIIGLVFLMPTADGFDKCRAGDDQQKIRSDSSKSATASAETVVDLIVIEDVHVRFQDRAKLSFQRTGMLAEILVTEGQTVVTGDQIASLDTSVANAEYQVAKATAEVDSEVRLAAKQRESAEHEYSIVMKGNKESTSSQPPFPQGDVIRLKLAAASSALEEEVRRDQQKLNALRSKQAFAELEAHRIKAPFDGLITQVLKSVGESVQQTDPIAEIVNTRVIVIEGYVALPVSLRIRRGCRAEFTSEILSDPETKVPQSFVGEVRLVDVTVEEAREVVRISTVFQNPDGVLREGISGTLRITPFTGSIAVPASREP